MTDKEFTKIAIQLNLITKDLKKNAQSQNNTTEVYFEMMNEISNNTQQKMHELLRNSNSILQKQADEAFTTIIEKRFLLHEDKINQLCENVQYTTRLIQNATREVSKQNKVSSWIMLGGSALMGFAVVSFSMWYGWGTKEKTEALLDYYDRIELAVEIKELTKGAGLSNCNGKLCYQSLKDPIRYDKNNEYILIQSEPKNVIK